MTHGVCADEISMCLEGSALVGRVTPALHKVYCSGDGVTSLICLG